MTQLPAILQHISQALQDSSSRVLVAGSAGFEGEAAIVLAAYAAQRDGQDIYHALVQLQHCHHMLQVCATYSASLGKALADVAHGILFQSAIGNSASLVACGMLRVSGGMQLQDRHKLQLTQWSSRMRKSEQSNRTPSGGTTFT